MSGAVTIAGWALAALAAAAALLLLRERRAEREAVARVGHELRGPLTAVRLGLALCSRADAHTPGRIRALDAELARAALALEDLSREGVRGRGGGGAAPVGGGAGRGRRRGLRCGLRCRGLRCHGRRRRARGGADRPALDRVALGPLLETAVAAAAGRAAAAGATVSGSWRGPAATVWGDRTRLSQALGNLVANAVEHGGGHVRVTGELCGGSARITVDDDGPGLPAPVAELARRPRAGRGARGRGLAIASSIAEAHAGSVAAAPVARGGRIVLSLPARSAAAAGSTGGS